MSALRIISYFQPPPTPCVVRLVRVFSFLAWCRLSAHVLSRVEEAAWKGVGWGVDLFSRFPPSSSLFLLPDRPSPHQTHDNMVPIYVSYIILGYSGGSSHALLYMKLSLGRTRAKSLTLWQHPPPHPAPQVLRVPCLIPSWCSVHTGRPGPYVGGLSSWLSCPSAAPSLLSRARS